MSSTFYVNITNNGFCERIFDQETGTLLDAILIHDEHNSAESYIAMVKLGMIMSDDEVDMASDNNLVVYGHELRTMGYTDVKIACYSVR